MAFEKMLEDMSDDDRFKATVYAINSLLQARGLYTRQEFEAAFLQWVEKDKKKKKKAQSAA